MRWSRRWGRMRKEDGFDHETRWGAEWSEYPYAKTGRVTIVVRRGRIVPCEHCKLVAKCAMYKSFTRTRLHGEYSHGTNELHMCDIYVPARSPGNITVHPLDNRSRGGEPT